MEGDFTLQNVIQTYGTNRSVVKPLKRAPTAFSKVFNEMGFNKPLYYFTLPGFILVALGLHMGLNFLQIFYFGGIFSFESFALMILLNLVGSFMAFIGILLHSITGLIRYTMNNQ